MSSSSGSGSSSSSLDWPGQELGSSSSGSSSSSSGEPSPGQVESGKVAPGYGQAPDLESEQGGQRAEGPSLRAGAGSFYPYEQAPPSSYAPASPPHPQGGGAQAFEVPPVSPTSSGFGGITATREQREAQAQLDVEAAGEQQRKVDAKVEQRKGEQQHKLEEQHKAKESPEPKPEDKPQLFKSEKPKPEPKPAPGRGGV